jgi:hypothetical protein
MPTLQDLAAETLMQKHKRVTQAKCQHHETYSSTVSGPNGTFTNGFCWDCGKSWRSVDTLEAPLSQETK